MTVLSSLRLFLIAACLTAASTPAVAQETNLWVEINTFAADDLGEFRVSVNGTVLTSGGDGSRERVSLSRGTVATLTLEALEGTEISDYATVFSCRNGQDPLPVTSFAMSEGPPRTIQLPIPIDSSQHATISCRIVNLRGVELPTALDPSVQCEASAIPPVVRAEGITELVGDIVLECSGTEEPPTVDSILGTLRVDLNAASTNNIDFGEGALITDAVAVINENNCMTPSPSGSVTGCGDDPRFQDPQFGADVSTADLNRIEWTNLSLPVPGAEPSGGDPFPVVTRIRIRGIRVDASAFGVPDIATFPFLEILAYVQFCGSTCVPISNPVINVGVPILGMTSEQELTAADVVQLTISEGFATSFKTQGSASFVSGLTQWESSYFAPGSNNGAGASSGTRVGIRFTDFEPGTSVSLPRQIDLGVPSVTGDAMQIVLIVGTDAAGAGGSPTELTGDESIALTDGSGFAVYEVLDANPFRNEAIEVPISFPSGGFGPDSMIAVNLAPISPIVTASSAEPEPRFTETFATEPLPDLPQLLSFSVAPNPVTHGDPVEVALDIVDAYPGVASAEVEIFTPTGLWPGVQIPLAKTSESFFEATVDTSDFPVGELIVFPKVPIEGGTYSPTSTRLDVHCDASISDSSQHWTAAGGGYTFTYKTTPGCLWQVESPFWVTSWHSIVDLSSTTLHMHYLVDANPTEVPRTGAVTIRADPDDEPLVHTITQDAGPPYAPTAYRAGTYSGGLWWLDADGNGVFDPEEDRSFALGFPGAQHFVGDWNGDGQDESAVFKDGFWFLDFDGDDVWDGGTVDKVFAFGWTGATPVVGDWDGDSTTNVGVYNNGFWFLDHDGNHEWDGGFRDKQFAFGWPGVEILIGDWNGDGRDKVGVFSNGFWFLDYDGDTLWDGGTNDKQFGWGWAGVKPIIGDWNGDGRDKAGAWVNGFWLLDYDGDNLWDGGTTDRLFGWGAQTATPVIGDWDNDGADSAGAFLDGEWVLDVDGDALWDGGTVDQLFNWGTVGDEPVVGRW